MQKPFVPFACFVFCRELVLVVVTRIGIVRGHTVVTNILFTSRTCRKNFPFAVGNFFA